MKTGTFFEINVSDDKNKHVFATDSSIRNYKIEDIARMIKLFKEKFPENKGYRISVTSWSCSGSLLALEDF